jgi:hypothetical protein
MRITGAIATGKMPAYTLKRILQRIPMAAEVNPNQTTGADAIDVAIASGTDFDGSPIPQAKLDLYHKVMGLEAGRQRSGVSNTMRSRIVRIGAKHISQAELDQMLVAADFAPLKEKEIAFYYGGK